MKQKSTILFALLLAAVLLLSACAGAPGAQGTPGEKGETGAAGKSAYEIWLDEGYEGTQADFLNWLKGEPGEKGEQGAKGESGVGIESVEFTKANEIYVVLNDEAHTRLFVCQTSASRGLEYEIEEDDVYITGIGSCTDSALVIPRTIEGYPVSGIEEDAFRDCNTITSVAVPGSVFYLDRGAFYGCKNLTEAFVSDHVIRLSTAAFGQCTALKTIHVPNVLKQIAYGLFEGCESLESIEIPDGVEEIQALAFSGCTSLESVTIPGSVDSLGNAFNGCTGLTNVTIEEGVEFIYGAFDGCSNLTDVNIPNSVVYIGPGAFTGCPSLQGAVYENGLYLGNDQNPHFALIRGTSDTITTCTLHPDTKILASEAFSQLSELTSVTIPSGVEHIGTNAFYGCEKLQGAVYENAVYLGNAENPYLVLIEGTSNDITSCIVHPDTEVIADRAFYDFQKIENVTLPAGLKQIGNEAFRFCGVLESVNIPEGVVFIGIGAFGNCEQLQSAFIPVGVTRLFDGVFEYCYTLQTITYGGTEAQWWSAIWKDDFWDINAGFYCGDYTLVFAGE